MASAHAFPGVDVQQGYTGPVSRLDYDRLCSQQAQLDHWISNLQARRTATRQTLDDLLVPRLVCWQGQLENADGLRTPTGWGWAEGDKPPATDWWRRHDPSWSFSHTYRRPHDGAEAAVFTVRFPEDSERARRYEIPAAFVFDHEHDRSGGAV